MLTLTKHYVVFSSPGSFFHEKSEHEIGEWNTHEAVRIAGTVVERHGARPFGFHFETRLTANGLIAGVLRVEPKTIKTSGMHFINGRVVTYDDVVARNDPQEQILLSNMRNNDSVLICETRNGYLSTNEYREDACVVDSDGTVIDRGNSPERVAYRRETLARIARERGY